MLLNQPLRTVVSRSAVQLSARSFTTLSTASLSVQLDLPPSNLASQFPRSKRDLLSSPPLTTNKLPPLSVTELPVKSLMDKEFPHLPLPVLPLPVVLSHQQDLPQDHKAHHHKHLSQTLDVLLNPKDLHHNSNNNLLPNHHHNSELAHVVHSNFAHKDHHNPKDLHNNKAHKDVLPMMPSKSMLKVPNKINNNKPSNSNNRLSPNNSKNSSNSNNKPSNNNSKLSPNNSNNNSNSSNHKDPHPNKDHHKDHHRDPHKVVPHSHNSKSLPVPMD